MRKRLELAVPTEPRDPSMDKDALLQNSYIDTDPAGTLYTVKRPGFIVGSEAITVGDNKGIFVNPQALSPSGYSPGNTTIWYINNNTGVNGGLSFFNTGYECYDDTETYNIGDVVTMCPEETPYYPTTDGVTGIPPTGHPLSPYYWSPNPPGEERYVGIYDGFGPICTTREAAGFTSYQAGELHKTCATAIGSGPEAWFLYAGVVYSNPFFPFDFKYYIQITVLSTNPPYGCSAGTNSNTQERGSGSYVVTV